MLRRVVYLIALSTVLPGCAALLDRVPQQQMASRLAYQGFSFERPADPNWYLLRSQESQTDVTLRRDTSSPTHTFYARVTLGSIAREPESADDLLSLVRAEGDGPHVASYEVETISSAMETTEIQKQWCVRFAKVAAVRGAPVSVDRELRMILRGYRCLHPAFAKATLDFVYSERGLPDELDPSLAEEGEEFLRGVRIDVAPGVPAGASEPLPADVLRR